MLLEELDNMVESTAGTLLREGRKFQNGMEMECADFDVLAFDVSPCDFETTP